LPPRLLLLVLAPGDVLTVPSLTLEPEVRWGAEHPENGAPPLPTTPTVDQVVRSTRLVV